MTSDARRLREYLVGQACAKFPEAFETVANPDFYTFATDTSEVDKGSEMVKVGLYDRHKNRKGQTPLWAFFSRSIIFYYEQAATLQAVEFGASGLFPDFESIRLRNAEHPFNLVAPQSWPAGYEEKSEARKLARDTLQLLVKFAFILTERRFGTQPLDKGTLLKELQQLCECLQRNQGEKTTAAPDDVQHEGEDSPALSFREQSATVNERQSYDTRTKRSVDEVDDALSDQGIRSKSADCIM